MDDRGPQDYLGDGVYVEYTGGVVILRADDHLTPTNTIYLELRVVKALLRFIDHYEADTK